MAADRTTGVELTEELHPAVVLIDVGMPGQNGYEVAHRIRATSRGRSIRIIAMTGYGLKTSRAPWRPASMLI